MVKITFVPQGMHAKRFSRLQFITDGVCSHAKHAEPLGQNNCSRDQMCLVHMLSSMTKQYDSQDQQCLRQVAHTSAVPLASDSRLHMQALDVFSMPQ